jgi:hypothetical protein
MSGGRVVDLRPPDDRWPGWDGICDSCGTDLLAVRTTPPDGWDLPVEWCGSCGVGWGWRA